MIDFGNVTNDGVSYQIYNDSSIMIEWDALTMDTIDNNTMYWVSAGAEYNNRDEIWIGQAGFMSLLDDYTAVSRCLYFFFSSSAPFPSF